MEASYLYLISFIDSGLFGDWIYTLLIFFYLCSAYHNPTRKSVKASIIYTTILQWQASFLIQCCLMTPYVDIDLDHHYSG